MSQPTNSPQPEIAEFLAAGSTSCQEGRYEAALAAYEHAIRLAPNEPCAYTGKGFVLLEIHRFGEALAAFEQALQLAQALG